MALLNIAVIWSSIYLAAGLLAHGHLLNYNTAWVGARLEEDGVLRWLDGQEIGRPRTFKKGLLCGAVDLEGPLVRSCDIKLPSVCEKDLDLSVETTVPTTVPTTVTTMMPTTKTSRTHLYTEESKETYKTAQDSAFEDFTGTHAATTERNGSSEEPTTNTMPEGKTTVYYERGAKASRIRADNNDGAYLARSTDEPISSEPTSTENGVLVNVVVGLGVAVAMLVVGLIVCSFHKCRRKKYRASALTEAMTKNSVDNIYEYIDDNTLFGKGDNKPYRKDVDTYDTGMIQSTTKIIEDMAAESTYDEPECVSREQVPQSKDAKVVSTDIKPPCSARGRRRYIDAGGKNVHAPGTGKTDQLNDAYVGYIDMAQSPTIRHHRRSGSTPYENALSGGSGDMTEYESPIGQSDGDASSDMAVYERPVEPADDDAMARVLELTQLNGGYMDMAMTAADTKIGKYQGESCNKAKPMVNENTYQSNSFSIVIQGKQ